MSYLPSYRVLFSGYLISLLLGVSAVAATTVSLGVLSLIGILVITAAVAYFRPRSGSTYGSAKWGNPTDHYTTFGMLLGTHKKKRVGLDGEGHVLTIASTGSGKNVSSVIPNLLTYPGSVIVTDPKGENCAVTASRRLLFGPVYRMDPFGVIDRIDPDNPAIRASINPMDIFETEMNEDLHATSSFLADLLLIPSTKSDGDGGSHWDREARAILSGMILRALAEPLPHLGVVSDLLTIDQEEFEEVLEDMAKQDGLLAMHANNVLSKAHRERSSILSTAQQQIRFLYSDTVRKTLETTNIDFTNLKNQTITVYLVMPPDYLNEFSRWLRLIFGVALWHCKRPDTEQQHRVLLLMDEFASMGKMKQIEDAISIVRGYGVTLWILLQDIPQLKRLYPAWNSFIANSKVLQIFGTNDNETAKYISERLGRQTVLSKSKSIAGGLSSRGTKSETGRELMTANEISLLGESKDLQLLIISGARPLKLEKIKYFTDPYLSSIASPNPYYEDSK